jgi:predicted glycosyltransferase
MDLVEAHKKSLEPPKPMPAPLVADAVTPPHVRPGATAAAGRTGAGKKIWIDLENTPHIPFFRPIIRELEQRGYTVVLTARDAFQVCELADRFGLPYKKIGRHYGKNRLLKAWGLAWRSLQLLGFVLKERPMMGLNHGARAQIVVCNLFRIPTVMIMDYEHSKTPAIVAPRWEIVPEVLLSENLHAKSKERIRKYRGIKEDVYAPEFKPDTSLSKQLNLGDNDIIITVRPPATEAHYHNPESEKFFVEFMERVMATPGVRAVLLPRNKAQESHIRANWPKWLEGDKVIVPKQAVDGLNLLWHSDLVVSGGGTMNREAAALGIPVYSIFRGKSGAVDRHLQKEGKMVLIETSADVQNKILLQRRDRNAAANGGARCALSDIVREVEGIIGADCRK